MSSPRPGVWRATLVGATAVLLPALVVGLASAQLAPPPPTPVPPDGSLSPFPSVLHTPADAVQPPDIGAASAILVDLATGQVLFSRDPDARRPIASLTKIMTALLVLERSHLTDIVTVRPDAVISSDARAGVASLGLQVGERISVEDLLYALLLQSANDAAVALADHVAGSQARFVRMMNARAHALGMTHTRYRSASGLDDRGYSSARDLATLTRAAMSTPGFDTIASTEFRTIPGPDGDRHVQNRNVLLWLYPGATGAKTGYTARAGNCVVGTAERDGRRLVTVVLGEPGEPFSDAAALLDHGFEGFTRHTFVTEGEPHGVVTLPGGSVPVESAGDVVALVPTTSISQVDERVVVDPQAAYPPAPGEPVARLKITIPGLTVGTVPLVVSAVPPPPPIGDEPWWGRALGAVADAIRAAVTAIRG